MCSPDALRTPLRLTSTALTTPILRAETLLGCRGLARLTDMKTVSCEHQNNCHILKKHGPTRTICQGEHRPPDHCSRLAYCDASLTNFHAARGVAICVFPLPGYGAADYLLYIDGKAAGVIEAKKEGHTLTGVEIQSDKLPLVRAR